MDKFSRGLVGSEYIILFAVASLVQRREREE